ncbi:uncharacterized protein LOC129581872 isoform X2 [Paramacrobiotus metropolitanus]|uniref:uncharacterized protein LOC129581872 isoform X2 n=1 Tax=Paramacrobiotus metropolitanus TaxID=2943436 RepID=UPI002445D1A1|nr:uncharacterized protein LOC129581872 isoform X2 [Paramacrobiotus metropolitanus]
MVVCFHVSRPVGGRRPRAVERALHAISATSTRTLAGWRRHWPPALLQRSASLLRSRRFRKTAVKEEGPAPPADPDCASFRSDSSRASGSWRSQCSLSASETTDLVNLPEEQIWQKRDEPAVLQQSADALAVDSLTMGTPRGSGLTMNPPSGSAQARHSADRDVPASARTRPAIATSQSEHYDLQHRQTLPTSGTGLTHLLSPGGLDDYQYARQTGPDTSSIRSSERSKATQKSSKSLTRRLSSFFTRSFRRKRTPAGTPTTPGSESKRVSYSASAASYDERPGSAATRLSLEDSDYIAQRSQQLLRLGFSLNIEEALAQEPDTFVFVPLTDSGYFSSDCDDLEKLPEVSLMELEEVPLPDSPPRPTPPPRHTNPASQRHRPTALRPHSNRLSDGHSPVTHPLMRQTDVGGSPMGSPVSYDGASTSGGRRETPGRRLSFIEGTSVMESINHLAYPSQMLLEEDDGLPPVSRRAKEKLRFKRHPWKWIKSKF